MVHSVTAAPRRPEQGGGRRGGQHDPRTREDGGRHVVYSVIPGLRRPEQGGGRHVVYSETPGPGRMEQKDHEFESSLNYIARYYLRNFKRLGKITSHFEKLS